MPKIDINNISPDSEEKEKDNVNDINKALDDLTSQYDTEIAKLKNEILLAAADADNLRKRYTKEIDEVGKFAVSKLLQDVIVPLEQLFMALSMPIPEENQVAKDVITGIEMTKQEFLKTLVKYGLERVFPEGKKFDHNFHQAVSQVEAEGVESGIVVQVVQAGYSLHGRVLRPAMVIVRK